MNDARLDALLVAADPLPAPVPDGIGRDAVAGAARARVLGARRRTVPARRVALATAGFAALAALVVALIVASPRREPAEPATAGLIPVAQRHLAPNFDLPMLVRGESHKVGWNLPHAGPREVSPHPLVIVFAESWCVPCRAQIEQAESLWTTKAVGDLAVLGIARRSAGNQAWWASLGATFPLAIDRTGKGARAFGVTGEPETILIDREGRIAAHLRGVTDPAALSRAVDALLTEPPPPQEPEPTPIAGPVPASALDMAVFHLPAPTETPPRGLTRFTPRVYAESIRLALRAPSGFEIWMARAEGDWIVIADSGPSDPGGQGADPARSLARRGGTVMWGGKPWFYAGTAVDGYTRATGGGRSVPIRNNVFLFEGGKHFSHVTLTGPAGTLHLP